MDVEIDFDAASTAWRANKKPLGGGWFIYICEYIHSNGKRCQKPVESAKKPPASARRDGLMCRSISINPHHYCWKHRYRKQAQLFITDGVGAL